MSALEPFTEAGLHRPCGLERSPARTEQAPGSPTLLVTLGTASGDGTTCWGWGPLLRPACGRWRRGRPLRRGRAEKPDLCCSRSAL